MKLPVDSTISLHVLNRVVLVAITFVDGQSKAFLLSMTPMNLVREVTLMVLAQNSYSIT